MERVKKENAAVYAGPVYQALNADSSSIGRITRPMQNAPGCGRIGANMKANEDEARQAPLPIPVSDEQKHEGLLSKHGLKPLPGMNSLRETIRGLLPGPQTNNAVV